MLNPCALDETGGRDMTEVLRADFEPAPPSVGLARRAVLRTLVQRGLGGIADTTCLLTSELVTNALQHAPRSVDVVLDLEDARLRVEVRDDGKRTPPPLAEARNELGTFWLLLLADLANRWGFEHERGGGGVVWFEVELDGEAPASGQRGPAPGR